MMDSLTMKLKKIDYHTLFIWYDELKDKPLGDNPHIDEIIELFNKIGLTDKDTSLPVDNKQFSV